MQPQKRRRDRFDVTQSTHIFRVMKQSKTMKLLVALAWIFNACHSFLAPHATLSSHDLSSMASPSSIHDDEEEKPSFFTDLPNIERVFALSDLHVDHVLNMDWIRQKMAKENCTMTENDLIIVAGDISHDLEKFEECMNLLTQQGSGPEVLFVVGNHEAWLTPAEVEEGLTSLDKFTRIYELCDRLDNVHTGCVKGKLF